MYVKFFVARHIENYYYYHLFKWCTNKIRPVEIYIYIFHFQEIDFVQRRISFAPNNESSWNYFYGLLMPIVRGKKYIHNSSCKLLVDQNSNIKQNIMSDLQIMQKFAEELVASDQIAGDCLAPLSFLVEVYADCLESYFTEKSGSTCETHSRYALFNV